MADHALVCMVGHFGNASAAIYVQKLGAGPVHKKIGWPARVSRLYLGLIRLSELSELNVLSCSLSKLLVLSNLLKLSLNC